ncbi:hypothetical protein AMAG_01795 [Allomyces macrogynus ATCC 38327]|uniref:Uncharacterized protein n=1 Tax=Allomyces macrogynus (strain ATCC 38327) TaxID=578462 RepID=A0A0L0S069_ALLM3|nr:hypothetical protein AMAG_01795 [Allomyces macrogynus ATCC 38327]|eukprot:KNE55943.1 hypothetical protein AMAG_01795 [Allomyces macrogynus ATCC 38327]
MLPRLFTSTVAIARAHLPTAGGALAVATQAGPTRGPATAPFDRAGTASHAVGAPMDLDTLRTVLHDQLKSKRVLVVDPTAGTTIVLGEDLAHLLDSRTAASVGSDPLRYAFAHRRRFLVRDLGHGVSASAGSVLSSGGGRLACATEHTHDAACPRQSDAPDADVLVLCLDGTQ